MDNNENHRAGKLDQVVNVAVLGFVLIALASPRGPLGGWLGDLVQQRATRELIAENWSSLAPTGPEPTAASRVLIEFFDYQCPYCRRAETTIQAVAALEDATLIHRHLPLRLLHPYAESAALAAICADLADEFSEMHQHLLTTDRWQSDTADWFVEAESAGMSAPGQLVTCMASDQARARLRSDEELAVKLGIRMTPTFVGYRGVHAGIAEAEDLRDLLP